MVYGRIWSAKLGFGFALSFSMSFWRSAMACSLAVSWRATDAGISYTRTTLSCAGTMTLSLWCHTVRPSRLGARRGRDRGARELRVELGRLVLVAPVLEGDLDGPPALERRVTGDLAREADVVDVARSDEPLGRVGVGAAGPARRRAWQRR